MAVNKRNILPARNIVMKFGGTSVQDSASIENVINIVRKQKAGKIVVVSAISKATNSLEQIARLAGERKVKEARPILEELIYRHHTIINNLVENTDLRTKAIQKINNFHFKIVELMSGVAIINELSLRTLDAFRVFGELMSSIAVFFAMKNKGMNVEWVDSRDIIKTNNEFSRAYPDFELSQKNVNKKIIPLLRSGKTILAQGFIASTTDGISTTMGRESSDFSAAIYGALIDADEIQIWTDVDGVLTADPNIIKNTMKLSEISFSEMEELSNFGAKVLHKNSIKPALMKKIPLKVLNSKNSSSRGTLIHSTLKYHKLIKSITYKKNIIVLRLKPKENLDQFIFWDLLINALGKHKPQIDIMLSSSNSVIIVIAENNYTRIHYDDLKKEIEGFAKFDLVKEKSLITLVGSDLNSIERFQKRVFNCMPGIKPESIVFGFNQHSFSMLMDASNCEKVLKSLHKEFFENHRNSIKLFEKLNK
jgi:aspartate kinase